MAPVLCRQCNYAIWHKHQVCPCNTDYHTAVPRCVCDEHNGIARRSAIPRCILMCQTAIVIWACMIVSSCTSAAHACTQQHIMLQSTVQSHASQAHALHETSQHLRHILTLTLCNAGSTQRHCFLPLWVSQICFPKECTLHTFSPKLHEGWHSVVAQHASTGLDTNPVIDLSALTTTKKHTWAARYNTWLLNKLSPKGVVFSFLFCQTTGFREVRVHTSWCCACSRVCWPARFGNQAFMTEKMTVSSCRECSVWTKWKTLNWAEKALMEAGRAGVMHWQKPPGVQCPPECPVESGHRFIGVSQI